MTKQPSPNELLKKAKEAGSKGDATNALSFAIQAVNSDPKNQETRTYLAQLLINLGKYAGALEQYYELLKLNPQNYFARSRIRTLHLRLVDAWHFPMLNDQNRNKAFEKVITKSVKPGMIVLDIGSGSGLLAMLAAKAGAKHVYSCEQCYPLARVANEIVKRNNLADKITIINRWSSDLVIGKDLPERADLLIAEIFGSSLVDEHVSRFFNHANNQLLKPEAAIIPARGMIYGGLIESQAIKERVKVNKVCGFDVNLFNALYDEPTTQVSLQREKHLKLSKPFELFNYNFKQELKPLEQKIFEAEIINDGNVDGIAMWFKLDLDAETSIETGPEQEETHWQQLVQVFDVAVKVQKGQKLKLIATNHDDRIVFSLA